MSSSNLSRASSVPPGVGIPSLPAIVIDTREQQPLDFSPWHVHVTRGTLLTGDYSLAGHEHSVALERKSLSDLYACVGRERPRFERELARLAAADYGAVVIESTLAEVLGGHGRSRVSPKSAVGSLLAWSVEHRLPIFFCGSRALTAATVLKLLTKFWKYRVAGIKRAARHGTAPKETK
jgi:ERCC4-type nuclease